MKKYTKPVIIVNRFETRDVIATSCTCPVNCFHINYYHEGMGINLPIGALNYFDVAGVCPEHGNYYEPKKG